jgi:diadenosine tetraphosphate (Ap4A) HIT family hydrolase
MKRNASTKATTNIFDRIRTMLLTRPAFVCAAGTIFGFVGLRKNIGTIQGQSNILTTNDNHEDTSLMVLKKKIEQQSTTKYIEQSLVDDDGHDPSTTSIVSYSSITTSVPNTLLSTDETYSRRILPIPIKSCEIHTPPMNNDRNFDPYLYMTNETPFGSILRGDIPASILSESNHLISFQDTHPRAPLHGLIIPKKQISSVLALTSIDLPMLYEMKQMANEIIQQYTTVSSINDNHDINYRLVFHIPPFYSVKHLHLHVLAPVNRMGWFYRQLKYPFAETRWCTHLDRVIHRLENGKTPVPYNILQYSYRG